jgi:DNA-binding LytR/AlgR family response regulator
MFDRTFWRGMGVALAAGVVLSLTGAFQTHYAGFWLRLAYWLPLMFVGGLWGQLCVTMIGLWLDEDRRPWLTILLMTLAMTGPLAVVVWAYTGLTFNGGRLEIGALYHFVLPVAVVTSAVAAINVFLSRANPVETHQGSPSDQPARFLDRLPLKLRGATLHAVESEDHYLRIHTDRGSDLILMRLSDAVAELEGLEGAQVHRSWWVARDAVTGARRGDGRATLTLKGGIEAPVSRRYAPALRKAGWY